MIEYIKESVKKAKNNRKEYTLYDDIIVIVNDNLPPTISLETVLKRVQKTVPKHLLKDLDSIYIGNFEILNSRQIDSVFINGSILITSNQPSEKELYGTMIHEIAHSIETSFKDELYADGQLAHEFISKRKTLYNMLKDDYELNKNDFLDINFKQEFDDFAYKTIGYENLGIITNGLFLSPYGCTSLREYFANGFEHYFLNDVSDLKQISPFLYKKIKLILKQL